MSGEVIFFWFEQNPMKTSFDKKKRDETFVIKKKQYKQLLDINKKEYFVVVNQRKKKSRLE